MSYNTDLFVITYHDDYVEIRDSKMTDGRTLYSNIKLDESFCHFGI